MRLILVLATHTDAEELYAAFQMTDYTTVAITTAGNL